MDHHSANLSQDDFSTKSIDSPELQQQKAPQFSIACKQCRRGHLACDKSMPSCVECTKRGRTCCYETPKKRGRKPAQVLSTPSNMGTLSSCSSSPPPSMEKLTYKFHVSGGMKKKKYHPYLDDESQSSYSKSILSVGGKIGMDDELIRNSFKLETIDFYYEYVDHGFSLVSKEEMRRLITKKGNGSNEESIKAMMYSIKAICEQRLANGNIAELSAKEARNSLSKSDYNLYTKISYAILADYLGGEGEDVLAFSYLNHLKNILGNVPTSFKYLLSKAERCATIIDRDYDGVLQGIMDLFTKFKPNHEYDLKSIETEGVNPMNAELAVSIVQAVRDTMNGFLGTSKYSDNYRQVKHGLHELVFVSGVSSIFFALGLDGEKVEELVERANGIIMNLDTLYVPVSIFPFLSIFMSYRVKQFGNIIVDFSEKLLSGMDVRSIFTEEKQHKYFNSVVQYMKIMQDFGKRYKRINKYYSKLSNDLALIAKWKFDVQMSTLPSQLNEYQSTPQLSQKEESISCLKRARLLNNI